MADAAPEEVAVLVDEAQPPDGGKNQAPRTDDGTEEKLEPRVARIASKSRQSLARLVLPPQPPEIKQAIAALDDKALRSFARTYVPTSRLSAILEEAHNNCVLQDHTYFRDSIVELKQLCTGRAITDAVIEEVWSKRAAVAKAQAAKEEEEKEEEEENCSCDAEDRWLCFLMIICISIASGAVALLVTFGPESSDMTNNLLFLVAWFFCAMLCCCGERCRDEENLEDAVCTPLSASLLCTGCVALTVFVVYTIIVCIANDSWTNGSVWLIGLWLCYIVASWMFCFANIACVEANDDASCCEDTLTWLFVLAPVLCIGVPLLALLYNQVPDGESEGSLGGLVDGGEVTATASWVLASFGVFIGCGCCGGMVCFVAMAPAMAYGD